MTETGSCLPAQEAEAEEGAEEVEEGAVSARDAPLMAGLLEAVIIMWEGSGNLFKVSLQYCFLLL